MIEIDGHSLTIEEIKRVARADEGVAPLADAVRASMSRSQEWLQGVIELDERTVYGVNTGFGPLATQRIRPGEARRLSRNVVLNCVAGVGDPLPREIVLDKVTFSGFTSSDLEDVLAEKQGEDLVFCGLATSQCVDTTARDASDREYNIILIEDALTDYDQDYHDKSLQISQGVCGGIIHSTDEYLKR